MTATISARFLRAALVAAIFLLSGGARAALTIEIIGAGTNQLPVAIVPFAAEESLPQPVTSVVAADLMRSGLFRMVDPGGIVPVPHEPDELNYPQWRARGAEAAVIGSVARQAGGRYEVRFRLMDVVKQTQLAGFAFAASESQLRLTAHRIADIIYEKLTGGIGVFSTRIVYVIKRGTRYELQVADADGHNPQTVLASVEPIISPAWAPDGQRLAYVSFERKKPVVYVQSLITGGRQPIASYWGSNSSPAWAPDGRRLAVTLTKDGGSHIYFVSADGSGEPVQVTRGTAIETEATFSPNGQSLLFTSDRGGSPQIYRMPVAGGLAQRLTFEGNYNVSPRFSPDGKSFTFIQRNGNQFNVAVQDLATRQMQLLTEGATDESPTYAPNGRMILYATVINGRGILAAVSSDGRVKQRLTEYTGDVREPAWGPLVK